MSPLPLWQIDAFTDRPFAGNPAAVCHLDAPRPEAWYQAIAAEMNLAETAFLLEHRAEWALRWFTPEAEVDLCGHATLATAHYLWERGLVERDRPVRFQSKSGLLTAECQGEWIRLDFPATPPTPTDPPPQLFEALGVPAAPVLRSRFDLLVDLPDPARLRTLTPDIVRLGALPVRGIIVTAPSDVPGVDFLSRFFAPAVGVAEDPVTGSAHCALAPFWCERLGRRELIGYQASRRGGRVRVACRDGRVDLAGQAVTVLRGEIVV